MTKPTITTLDDGYYRVCLSENKIEACTTCSSAHLIEDKVAQLKRTINRIAAEAYAA
jgi:hypothetical protein